MPISLADLRPITTHPRMLVSPTGAPGASRHAMRSAARALTMNATARRRIAQPRIPRKGVRLTERQRRHRVAIHSHNPAPAPQIAVALLLAQQEVQPSGHVVRVSPLHVSVAGPEVREQG